MDRRLRELLDWLERNQAGNPYAKEMPFHPWGKKGVKPVPFPEIGEDPMRPRKIPDWWNRGEKFPLDTGPRKEWWGQRMPYFPKEEDKFRRRKFGGNTDDFLRLLRDAQVGSAMPKLHKSIDPLSQYPHYGGTSRGLRREKVSGAEAVKEFEERATGPQLGGVPESDRKFVDTMHRIQNAYFTGADFGYEEGWTDQLGSTQEQIDMFMAVPEEAIKHAMDNPTDAVLQEFEEYYGFPLNVNDPDMQKYFEDRKKKRPRG